MKRKLLNLPLKLQPRPNSTHGMAQFELRKAKVDNTTHFLDAKVEIRRRAMHEIGVENCHVFDAFAGEGTIYQRCYRDAGAYCGCDRAWFRDERTLYVADNLRLMRAIDLSAFNVFDLDAYGSPWKQWLILLARRPLQPGEKIAVFLTEGTASKLITRNMDYAMAEAAGISRVQYGAKKHRLQIIDRAIDRGARRWGAKVVARWQVDNRKLAFMSYISLVFEGRLAVAAKP